MSDKRAPRESTQQVKDIPISKTKIAGQNTVIVDSGDPSTTYLTQHGNIAFEDVEVKLGFE